MGESSHHHTDFHSAPPKGALKALLLAAYAGGKFTQGNPKDLVIAKKLITETQVCWNKVQEMLGAEEKLTPARFKRIIDIRNQFVMNIRERVLLRHARKHVTPGDEQSR